jgi:hypothetical protein
MKAPRDRSIASIAINKEELNPHPLKSGMRQECLVSPLYLIQCLNLSQSSREEEEIKGKKIAKEEVKLRLLTDYMILYSKTHKTLLAAP